VFLNSHTLVEVFAGEGTAKLAKGFSKIDDVVPGGMRKVDFPDSGGYVKTDLGFEYKFSKVDLDTHGDIVKVLANDPEMKSIAAKWGIGRNGDNQLLAHTVGKLDEVDRFPKLEKSAGMPQGTFDVLANNPIKVNNALKSLDKLTNDIISNPTKSVVLEGGKKEIFWKQALHDYNEGITVIKYEGKVQSVMNSKINDFKRMTKGT